MSSAISIFKTPESERQFMAVYEAVLDLWPVPFEPLDVPTRFGITHTNACGDKNRPPMVLLPGYGANSTMWFPNVAALKSQFRIYAIDTPGQPGKISSVGSPAYSQSDNLALLQILSITGMWGVTFLIMWCASTVNSLWEHQFDWRPVKGTLGGFVVVFLAALLFGSVQLSFSPPSSQTVEAATITLDSAVSSEADSPIDANFNQSTDAQRAAARPKIETSVDQILSRTETALRGGAKMVSWEEGSGRVLEEDKPQTLDRVAALAKQYNAYLQVSLEVLTRTSLQHFVYNQSILVDNIGDQSC